MRTHTTRYRQRSAARGPFFQAKLTVNTSGDAYEQEADRIADQVVQRPAPAPSAIHQASSSPSFFSPSVGSVQRKCAACEHEEKEKQGIQRKEGSAASPSPSAIGSMGDASGKAVPSIVSDVLSSGGGQPMESSTRQFMESRFGQDFSQVRIHTDSRAAESASAIQARAYTSGRDVVFGAGEYQPGSEGGRRLLAHELVHVGQQGGVSRMVQRDGAEESKDTGTAGSGSGSASATQSAKEDLAIQLIDDSGKISRDEAKVRAPNQIRAISLADLVAKLSAYKKPIGRLYIMTHSNSTASVEIHDTQGNITTVALDDVSKALSGKVSNAPDEVVLLGCSMGSSASKLATLKQAVGATSTSGFTCWTFTQRSTPFTYRGKPVTTDDPNIPQQLKDQGVQSMMNGLTSADGTAVKDCILGLGPTQSADLQTVKQIYFKNRGMLVAAWLSPHYNYNWQADSICEKAATTSTSPCKKIVT